MPDVQKVIVAACTLRLSLEIPTSRSQQRRRSRKIFMVGAVDFYRIGFILTSDRVGYGLEDQEHSTELEVEGVESSKTSNAFVELM